MEQNVNLETAKIVTKSKLPDKELDLKIYRPTNPFDAKLGDLYFLIEIKSPWQGTRKISETILDAMISAYYQEYKSFIELNKRFEAGIKNVNHALGEKARKGETEWINNLSAIIFLVQDKEIVFSACGEIEAYLFRENKISHLTENKEIKTEKEPSRTFDFITSGRLNLNDKIVIANTELFDYVSLDSLRQEFISAPPAGVAAEVASLLKKDGISSINALFLKLNPEKELTNSDLPETIYLDKKLTPFLKNTAFITDNLTKIKEKSSPVLKEAAIKVGFKTIALKDKLSSFFGRRKTESENEEPSYPSRALELETSKARRKFNPLFFPSRFFSQILKYKKWILIVLAIILLFILGFFISCQRKKMSGSTQTKSAQEVLSLAKNKIEAAKNKAALHDEQSAKDLYFEAQTLLLSIKDNKDTLSEVNLLLTEIEKEINKINKVVLVNLETALVDFSTLENEISPLGIEVSGATIFSLDQNKGDIFSFREKEKKPRLISSVKSDDKIIAETYLPTKETIIYLANSGKIFEFEVETTDTQERKTGATNLQTVDFAAAYFSNLYLLSKKEGQIYKFVRLADDFAPPIKALKTEENFAQAVDFAIDGYIYVLFADGQVLKFLSGKKVTAFSLSNLPTPKNKIGKATKIYTDPDALFIWVLDAQERRVIKFDKDGKYKKQYQFGTEIPEPTDIFVKEKTNSLYLLSGTKIYKIDL